MKKEDKDNMTILAFQTKDVFPSGVFQGYARHSDRDYQSEFVPHLREIRRGDAEGSEYHKHPIPYVMIVNPENREVFAYKRASKSEHAHESRLHGNWSWGVGGHVEPVKPEEHPIESTMYRELEEEIEFDGSIEGKRVLGYINDDRDSVGKVHFAVLYLIETRGDVRPRDSEIEEGRFMGLSEIEELCGLENAKVEGWSEIALSPLREYFSSLS